MSTQGIELAILKTLISPSRSINEADRKTSRRPYKFLVKMRCEQQHPKSNNAMESEISFSGLEYLARVQLRNCGAASVGEYSR